MTAPRATVRLQLHAGFGFEAARTQLDYFATLGISHLYLSPILRAQPGSTHGYDTVDYGEVSPELGGESALRTLADAAHARGLGLIVDVVPNHMGIAGLANAWWVDLLERGRASTSTRVFEIDWRPRDGRSRDKVRLPVLGKSIAEAIDAGELRYTQENGRRCLAYYDQRFPLNADAGDGDIAAVLARQHYVLLPAANAGDTINWRRFFDIGELAAIRCERRDVFDAVHAKLLTLWYDDVIDGFRIDHVDGLADPRRYCRRLRRRLEALRNERSYIVVEKILAPGEILPDDWSVEGTTGYDFMDEVGALLHAADGAAALDALWHRIATSQPPFDAQLSATRREVLDTRFGADRSRCGRTLTRLAHEELGGIVWSQASLRRVLDGLLAALRVYRTYPGRPEALRLARKHASVTAEDAPIADWIVAVLSRTSPRHRRAARQVEQLTPALAAKALEDTLFYRYGRLISRNEVGADPSRLALAPDAFHARCAERLARYPDAMLATATHDHKRGEDTRARLAVLSEIADEWVETVEYWRAANSALRTNDAPDAIDEYFFYQSAIGAWPLHGDVEADQLVERLVAWQRKALREAKRRSSWTRPNTDYEDACERFARAVLAGPFQAELSAFVERIAAAGAVNGLTQTLLRLTVPGVPDLYQGTEFWDFSLVDPDNRRAVDYIARRAALDDHVSLHTLLNDWRSGHIKQALIRRALNFRRDHDALFRRGNYRAVAIEGGSAQHALAWLREHNNEVAIGIATRHAAGLVDAIPRVDPEHWAETRLVLPEPWRNARLVDVLTGKSAENLELARLLHELPVAMLAKH